MGSTTSHPGGRPSDYRRAEAQGLCPMNYADVVAGLPDLTTDDDKKKSKTLRVVEALPDLSQSASAGDRAQAAASGVNKGALALVPGLPVDTALNVADLVRS